MIKKDVYKKSDLALETAKKGRMGYKLYILVRAGMILMSQLILTYFFGLNFMALSYTISE